jgi:hypothetical protein
MPMSGLVMAALEAYLADLPPERPGRSTEKR